MGAQGIHGGKNKAPPAVRDFPMVDAAPLLRIQSRAPLLRRDLARGWNVVLFWGGPVAWMVGAAIVAPLRGFTSEQYGILLVTGTLWFGASCLYNALRCGRTHCWIDGVLLPSLGVLGGLNLTLGLGLSWSTFLSAFWGILLLSILVECIIGSYVKMTNR